MGMTCIKSTLTDDQKNNAKKALYNLFKSTFEPDNFKSIFMRIQTKLTKSQIFRNSFISLYNLCHAILSKANCQKQHAVQNQSVV